jgi:RNA polymerase sigma-70 factor (ECF subfamily)
MLVRNMEHVDHDEFVRLFTANERRVYAYILSLVPNWADADEILQETNVRLWREKSKYTPGTNFGAWACTVARFEVLSYRKHAERTRVQFTDRFLEVVAREMEEDDDMAARHQALAHCVEKLPPTNAEMLRAFYAPKAIGREVATRFGRTVDAFYKTMSRIRRVLHDCIQHRLEGSVNL